MLKTGSSGNLSNRTYLLGGLLSTVLFVISLVAFHAVYIKWVQLGLVVLFFLLGMLAMGAITSLSLLNDPKKSYSKRGIALRSGVVMAVFAVLIFGLTNVLNLRLRIGERFTSYANNECAIRVAYSLAILMFGVLLLRFISHFSPKKPVRFAGVLVLLASICVGVVLSRQLLPTEYLYPAYRAIVPPGGVKTADRGLSYAFDHADVKYQPTDNIQKNDTFEIRLAKNEREGLQLILCAREADKKVTLRVESLINAAGQTLPVRCYKERYIAVPTFGGLFSDDYPDALEPITAETVLTLQKDRLQPIYIETVSDKTAAAGVYTAKCELRDEAGNVLASPEITATVWDFTLPDTPASESDIGIHSTEFWTLMGFDTATVYGHNGNNGSFEITDAQREVYKQYYDYLLAHHFSATTLPYDILDDRADAYMSDPRVTNFCVPYPQDDDLLVKYYEKVTSNPEWAKKAYFYPIDEPNDADAYARYTEITDRLSRLCPGYNMVTPFYNNAPETGTGRSGVALQRGRSSFLCPESNVLDTYDTRAELAAARDEDGARLWWYVCCQPQGDYNNNFIYQQGVRHRILFWQQKMENITGFLYWDSIYCDKGNPWETSKTWDAYEAAGDGVLTYPGRFMGYDEPVGTLRLKNWCDGMEDYTYLTLAEEAFGRAWVDERISAVTTSLTEYTLDASVLERVRDEIGAALAAK